jgi:hypothetical protein
MLTIKENLNAAEHILIAGLNGVAENYYRMRHYGNENYLQRPERVFNAELYHQLRKLQESEGVNFLIHQEITKNDISLHSAVSHEPQIHEEKPCLEDFNNKRVSPDLVFHGGQDNLDNQLLVAELKMEGASRLSILKDLEKLLFYKLSSLKFQNAVFIYTGSKNELESKLELGLSEKMLQCLIKHNIVIALRELMVREQNWNIYQFNNL